MMATTYKRSKSGGNQSESASSSASPASSVSLSNQGPSQGVNNNAPKYGTLVPNRIFVGGISSNTTEAELSQLFSKYGNVKATKIIADRAGVSKGYGFVTFESEEEVKLLIQDANNIVLKERRLNIAPAIKKQIDVFVGQPANRPFDTSSPPPSTSNLYFHNGVPYTFHNGMAFFPPSTHHPTLAALPPADPSMYPSYNSTQNAPPAFGTPVLVPAPPLFMSQNYSYQPMPMTNGGPAQFIYPCSGSSNSGSGSPDNGPIPAPLPNHLYTQYLPHEAFYPQPIFISYAFNSGDYEPQDQQVVTDDRSSTLSSPRSDSDRSSNNRSPMTIPRLSHGRMNRNNSDHSRPNSEASSTNGANNTPSQHNTDNRNQVPVVSWQSIQDRDERLLYIRDGRRAFHPVIPPPAPTPPPMLLYQQPNYSNSGYQHPKPTGETSVNQRQNSRTRTKPNVATNIMPFIPQFPACFNNNNPLVMNNNYHEKKPIENNMVRHQKSNGRNRGIGRATIRNISPLPSNPPNSSLSCPSQMMQQAQLERSLMNSAPPRWCSNQPNVSSQQIKRLVTSKRQNGPNMNLNHPGNMRSNKKGDQECIDNDSGGGGDASSLMQVAGNPEMTSKMQSLVLDSSC